MTHYFGGVVIVPPQPAKLPDDNESQTNELSTSIGATVGTFASRIARKLKEQEQRAGVSQRATEVRHAQMLQAMTTIRKALQDTSKIKLGGRFTLEMDISDWEGWPRIQLDLIDSLIPDRIGHSLTITANDLRELGTVRFTMNSTQVLASLHLSEPDATEKIPHVLKRTVRTFLDGVAAYILNPAKPDEEQKAIKLTDEEVDEVGQQLSKEDLFVDEVFADQNMAETVAESGAIVKI